MMKALCYHGARDIRCEAVEDPKLMGQGGALVKMQACGICGSDLHIYHGQGFVPDTGYCVGHEAVGEIVEIGRDVKSFKVGDQVMISASVALGGCGSCANCRAGLTSLCLRPQVSCYGISPRLQGCQAEGIAVPLADQNLSRIPEGLTADQALLLTDNLPTAWMGVKNADVTPGATVAVVGLGPIGLMAVQIAFVLGAARVYAIDLVPERRARAAELGAVPLDSAEAFAVIKDATDGAMCTSVVEAVGIDPTIEMAISLAGRGATVSVFGANQNQAFKYPLWTAFNKQLTFRVAGCIVQDQWAELIPLVRGGRLTPEQYITHRMPLSEGSEAYRLYDAKEDGALKMVLTP
jgi:2-desacetyl-2-hydroxyethyl bacteriochlorophyllide A dehydrogenase